MCHQSSVCSSAFSLKHFVHHSYNSIVSSRLFFGQTHFHWCKILTSDWLLSPLQVWSHRCAGCNLRGRVEHKAAAERREGGGGRKWGIRSQPSADSSLPFCPPFPFPFSLYSFLSFSHHGPAAVLRLMSLFVVAVVVLCVNVCVCTPLGAPISRHVSSVILISSPRGTGELFTHQYSLSLQTMVTESALLYCLVVSYWWYWPLLVLAYSLFVPPTPSPAPTSHSHNRNISQNPHDININIVSYSWIFLV